MHLFIFRVFRSSLFLLQYTPEDSDSFGAGGLEVDRWVYARAPLVVSCAVWSALERVSLTWDYV